MASSTGLPDGPYGLVVAVGGVLIATFGYFIYRFREPFARRASGQSPTAPSERTFEKVLIVVAVSAALIGVAWVYLGLVGPP